MRAAARWLADQPLTLPDHVADRLDVVLAYLLGHKLSDAELRGRRRFVGCWPPPRQGSNWCASRGQERDRSSGEVFVPFMPRGRGSV
jgi:hypothetical protein